MSCCRPSRIYRQVKTSHFNHEKPILIKQSQAQGRLVLQRRLNSSWSAAQYLKFGDERTRPVSDLLAQVPLGSPRRVVDLGCGPGNSTAVLAARYPHTHLTGMDSSPDMVQKARMTLPNIDFTLADLNSYAADEPVDLFFSNAVFHWLPRENRTKVITTLINSQSSNSVFAFQVPDNFHEPSHAAMRQIASEGPWAETLNRLRPALDPFQSPYELYDTLKPFCSSVNLWHVTYHHVLENHEAIVEWVKGSGLRPFISPLVGDDRVQFLRAYLERLKSLYSSLHDGKVILHYPRLFVVAVRA